MKNWSEEELVFLENNYTKLSIIALCNRFKISRGTLNKKVKQLGLRREQKWNEDKEKFLIKNHSKLTLNQLSGAIGVSVGLVRQKKYFLGLVEIKVDSKWNRESVIREIQKLFENDDQIINSHRVKKNYPSLYSMARTLFKSWRLAIQEAGIDYDLVRLNTHELSWDKSTIINEISDLYLKECDLSSKFCHKHHRKLWDAATRYFFSWRSAIGRADLDYNEISKNILTWNKDTVKSLILQKSDKNLPLFASYAKKNYVKLYGAARTHFNTWREAIEFAGLNYSEINKRANEIDWTRDLIREMLVSMKEKKESLQENIVSSKFPSLRTAARRRFGTWEKALAHSGIDINDTRGDLNTDAYYGKQFEKLVYEILVALNRNIVYQNHIEIEGKIYIPDFIDINSGTWIDAKLSSWGSGVSDTVNKYLLVQDYLEIIYLKSGDRMMSGVKFIDINDFYCSLKKIGRNDLIERVKSIQAYYKI